jgi:Carboxypeptidase regulatory-like domain
MRESYWTTLRLALSLMIAFLALYQPVAGQEVTAAIVGTVTDPSGAPIPKAEITANDADHGTVWTARTNDVGVYNILRIPVGTYTIKVSAAGFQTAAYPPFTLVLNQTARVDVQMKVGQVTQTLEVTAAAPILKTDTTEVDTVIDARTNDNLPLATRNPVQLTLLAPGSVTVDAASLNLGSNTAEGGGRPYINGNREQANNFLLDGIDDNQTSENRLGFTPSPDAIQEFNLITQNASAEFGNFQGGIVNTSIKSGTNSFHGNAFEFFRNDIFNANKWENGLTRGSSTGVLPTPTLRWNMFGGTFGGPIVKNKLFFFADYQGGRLDHPPAEICNSGGNSSGAQTCTVLTADERGGNFAALLPTVQLLNPCAAGTGVPGSPCTLLAPNLRTPFAGNIIPSNMLNPAFTKLVTSSLYPASAGSAGNGFARAIDLYGQQYNTDQGDLKLDYNLGEKDRLFARYSQGNQNDPQSNSIGLLGAQVAVAHLYNTALDWTHTFSSSLINEARGGVNYVYFVNNNFTFPNSISGLAGGLGIAGVSSGLPLFGFGGGSITQPNCGTLTCLGENIPFEKFATTTIQFNDNVIYTHGRHVIKSGFQMNRYRVNVFYAGNGGELGMLLYNGQYTAPSGAIAAASNAAAAADFALGLPSLVGHGVPAGGGGWHQRNWLYATYVQDNWRVTNDLTLNLGLRYEAVTPWTETNNRQVNVNIFTGALEYPGNTPVVGVGSNGFSRGLYNSVYGWSAFQPRLGFAWSPAMWGGKTVIRGAYTISSYLEGTGTNLRLTQNPPNTPPQSQAINTTSGGAVPFATEAGPVAGAVIGGNPFIGATMLAWNRTVQPSMAQQYNLTVQREIATDTTFQIGYVGQHATHMMVPEWLTQGILGANGTVTPSPFLGGQNPPGVNGSTAASPTYGPNGFGVVKLTASAGSMKYNALQTVLQKRFGHGLEAQVSYTYSKCMTDSSGYFGTWSGSTQTTPASPYFQNFYNPRAEWAQCYWDSKHVLSAYAVYELPVGRGKQFGHSLPAVANAAIGNWSINPILSWHTGFPLAISGNDNSGTGSPGPRPNCNDALLRYPKTTSSAGLLWFDPNFITQTPTAPHSFGNCPAQGPIIGPGYVDADISLQKNFPFTETKRLQFRADFLNAFNHPNFGHPNMGTGRINTTQDARQIQLALKFYF